MQSWVLARLELETRPRHAQADNDRLCLLTSHPSAEDYRAFLVRVYGFESPVEAAIQRTTGLGEVLDVRERGHLKLLFSDLAALGVPNIDKLPRCRNVPPLPTIEDALGWAYVIERNMLLHGILRGHLATRLPDQVARAGAYLAGNERAVGARMRELGAALDAIAKTPVNVDRIVVGAHAAFRCQRRWFGDAVPSRVRVA